MKCWAWECRRTSVPINAIFLRRGSAARRGVQTKAVAAAVAVETRNERRFTWDVMRFWTLNASRTTKEAEQLAAGAGPPGPVPNQTSRCDRPTSQRASGFEQEQARQPPRPSR